MDFKYQIIGEEIPNDKEIDSNLIFFINLIIQQKVKNLI